ncbi:MAG: 16S rRNA (guanine(966)-N(2))-methyltransferase RsmD [Bacteroidetes bacterium]|nr:16S rRNA (guanine(966)-N(2))-methyltransferase RsmD [Bacteroidota bacterium]
MRIISGKFRGRRLKTVRDRSVRPTTDRAKQSIFDILSNRIYFEGICVLDLFAGSGSLGLEALSRGASSVVFVEHSSTARNVLEENVRSLGCSQQVTIVQDDVFWYLQHTTDVFDLVFADPPYKLEGIATIPNAIFYAGVLHENSYVVMEHSKESMVDLDESKYDVLMKPFGQTTVLILRARSCFCNRLKSCTSADK